MSRINESTVEEKHSLRGHGEKDQISERPQAQNTQKPQVTALERIAEIEASLWEAADQLRANSKLTSSEYCMPLLGVIFLRHANNRYQFALTQIGNDQSEGKMPKRPLVKGDFIKRRALMLPEKARYDTLLKLPKGSNLGAALVDAMNAIEAEFEPLSGQLPKEYDRFDNKLLEDLLRIFDSEALRAASGDVFGRIYEYFLMKFAMQGAQDNGEFFTPPSLVQTIVNVIEPDHGVVFDPACGSGGMFVQSSHFIEHEGLDTMQRASFYGQEKTATTIRLAKMNLAVHGLEGDIREANSFYEDVHRLQDGRALWGNCDFVMANPPFNVDMVDAERIKDDRRLPFGLPGVNSKKKVGNANYLWISYFNSYLGKQGRAGFVMSSQASSAGHGDTDVRRKLVETGDVDAMIAIRPNFFYTRAVPCELWFFDKGKPKERLDTVLMLDARDIYRKVTRKIYDFSPEQLANLTAIVWLYRGQHGRFLHLVESYIHRVLTEIKDSGVVLQTFEEALKACHTPMSEFCSSAGKADMLSEWEEVARAYEVDRAGLLKGLKSFRHEFETASLTSSDTQRAAREAFDPLSVAIKGLLKQIDLLYKLAAHAIKSASDLAGSEEADDQLSSIFDRRASNKLIKQLDEERRNVVETLKRGAYFHRQVIWLQDRFPKAEMQAVPGLCRVVSRAEIEAADWSLSPGVYVGVAPEEVDEDFDFEEALRDIHIELEGLNTESAELAGEIARNFEDLGI